MSALDTILQNWTSPIPHDKNLVGEYKAVVRTALYEIAEQDNPVTIRHLYYRLVALNILHKTKKSYGQVQRGVLDMRMAGEMPFGWIADNTRWIRQVDTYDSAEEMLDVMADTYAYSLWQHADVRVEVWCESDSIAGVLCDVTNRFRVPLMALKGYSSLSFIYEIAEEIRYTGKPVHVYYFGDHDPSGQDILRDAEKKIRKMAARYPISITKMGVTPEQIVELGLPTAPPKKTDTRAKNFKGGTVEVEAIPAPLLRQIAEACITQHLDRGALEKARIIEAEERATLRQVVSFFRNGGTL